MKYPEKNKQQQKKQQITRKEELKAFSTPKIEATVKYWTNSQ